MVVLFISENDDPGLEFVVKEFRKMQGRYPKHEVTLIRVSRNVKKIVHVELVDSFSSAILLIHMIFHPIFHPIYTKLHKTTGMVALFCSFSMQRQCNFVCLSLITHDSCHAQITVHDQDTSF